MNLYGSSKLQLISVQMSQLWILIVILELVLLELWEHFMIDDFLDISYQV